MLEWSHGGFQDTGYHKDTSRKLHINFQVSTLLESGPTHGLTQNNEYFNSASFENSAFFKQCIF